MAQCLNINRGNRFVRLVSMATKSRGLNLYAAAHFGADSAKARQTYALGDVVTTLIETEEGQTITLTHDTDTPRPYSRNILLQGTRGLARKYPEAKIYIEGRSPGDAWEDLERYRKEFEHPLWTDMQEKAKGAAGHGGMDYIENYRLVSCLSRGVAPDMDVYDAAAWSAVSALSEASIAGGGKPLEFPDFTRGAWKTRPPLGILAGADR